MMYYLIGVPRTFFTTELFFTITFVLLVISHLSTWFIKSSNGIKQLHVLVFLVARIFLGVDVSTNVSN